MLVLVLVFFNEMIGDAIRELLVLHKQEREEKLSQTERKLLEM